MKVKTIILPLLFVVFHSVPFRYTGRRMLCQPGGKLAGRFYKLVACHE